MSRETIRLAYVLLAIMSVTSFGGPFLLGSVLRGGDRPNWPPDRPIEWVAVIGVTGVVVAVMIGLSVLWLANKKSLNAAKRAGGAKLTSDSQRGGA